MHVGKHLILDFYGCNETLLDDYNGLLSIFEESLSLCDATVLKVTGNKFSQKNYYHHTGYPGGLKTKSFEKMQEDSPEKIIEKAVKGMLPKNKLANQIIKKLKVYSGSVHPHIGQQPKELSI